MADELRITEHPQLERPVLIAAFRGWNDGGQGASLAGGSADGQFFLDGPGDRDGGGGGGTPRLAIGCQALPSHHQSPSGDRRGPGGASISAAIFA